MKKLITYLLLMVFLFILFIKHNELGSIGILLGYFVGLFTAILFDFTKNK